MTAINDELTDMDTPVVRKTSKKKKLYLTKKISTKRTNMDRSIYFNIQNNDSSIDVL